MFWGKFKGMVYVKVLGYEEINLEFYLELFGN